MKNQEATMYLREWNIDIKKGRCTHSSGLVVSLEKIKEEDYGLNVSLVVTHIPNTLKNDMKKVEKLLGESSKALLEYGDSLKNRKLH